MNCGQCGKEIPAGQFVRLNGTPLHPEPCFAKALRGLGRPEDFVLELSQFLRAEVAYRLGEQSYEVLKRKVRR